jgi:acetyl esterase/lipase
MKFVFLLLSLLVIVNFSFAQCSKRYQQRTFNSIQKFERVVYSKNAPALLAASITTETIYNKDLEMDIFMPPVADTVTQRPVVILAHGGGFINVAFMGGTPLVGTMDNEDIQALADTLAHWGYVTASIEYRLGFNVLSPSSLKRAVWRGAQDMSAAIRFFRKNAAWFDIDPNKVFVGGSSAGALCALHSTFVDDAERLPESFEITPIIKRDLGKMHSRPVVELTGSNPFTGSNVLGNDVDSIPQGIAAYWGAIAELDWLHRGSNKAPVILFHGTNDLIVPYNAGRPFSGVILTAPKMYGSYSIDSTMTLHNLPHEFYTAQGEGHEYWGALNGDWTATGPNAYWPDILSKTGNFFYQLIKPTAPQIMGVDTIGHSTNTPYSIVNPIPGYHYCWEVQNGVLVSPNTNGSSVAVQFYNTAAQGQVTASAIDPAQAASEQGSKTTVISPFLAAQTIPTHLLQLTLAPNPAHQTVALQIEVLKRVKASVVLINVLGQHRQQQQIVLNKGSNQINLDVSTLPKGIYTVQVQLAGEQLVEQLVVE